MGAQRKGRPQHTRSLSFKMVPMNCELGLGATCAKYLHSTDNDQIRRRIEDDDFGAQIASLRCVFDTSANQRAIEARALRGRSVNVGKQINSFSSSNFICCHSAVSHFLHRIAFDRPLQINRAPGSMAQCLV